MMLITAENSYERFLRALHKAVYVIDRGADRLLTESMGGTFSQFLVLMATAQCPGLSQQKISAFLDLTPAAVSRQVDSLVEEGLLERKQDPSSRRSHVVNLTAKGEKRFLAMKNLLIQSFSETVAIDAKELDVASTTIENVVARMHPQFEKQSY